MEQRKPQNSGKKSFFDGAFGKYLVPGILLQSVLIGGGYATGREVISYGAMYGRKRKSITCRFLNWRICWI